MQGLAFDDAWLATKARAAQQAYHSRPHTAGDPGPQGQQPLKQRQHQQQQQCRVQQSQAAYAWHLGPQSGHAASTSARTSPSGGKREHTYGDGRRRVDFANGTTKYVLPDGLTMVHFVNGDMKKQHPGGLVEYYYKEVDTWHSTLPAGIEVRLPDEDCAALLANMVESVTSSSKAPYQIMHLAGLSCWLVASPEVSGSVGALGLRTHCTCRRADTGHSGRSLSACDHLRRTLISTPC